MSTSISAHIRARHPAGFLAVTCLACGGGAPSPPAGAGPQAIPEARAASTANVPACPEGTPIGRRVYLKAKASEVPMLSAPRRGAAPVLNARMTEASGRPAPRTLGPAYGLLGLCRTPEFVQVQIVEVDGRPVTYETGWIAARDVVGAPSAEEQAGLLWAVDDDPYLSPETRQVARAAALRLLREDPACEKVLDGDDAEEHPGQFYLTCKGRDGTNFNAWFDRATGRRVR